VAEIKIKPKNKIKREDTVRNTTNQVCLKWVFSEDRCKEEEMRNHTVKEGGEITKTEHKRL
jgi:hypothetical protein